MRRYIRTLEAIEDCTEHFGSLVTNAQVRSRDVQRCVARGYAKDIGVIEVSDDSDNKTGRTAIGYVLTDVGRNYLRGGRT